MNGLYTFGRAVRDWGKPLAVFASVGSSFRVPTFVASYLNLFIPVGTFASMQRNDYLRIMSVSATPPTAGGVDGGAPADGGGQDVGGTLDGGDVGGTVPGGDDGGGSNLVGSTPPFPSAAPLLLRVGRGCSSAGPACLWTLALLTLGVRRAAPRRVNPPGR